MLYAKFSVYIKESDRDYRCEAAVTNSEGANGSRGNSLRDFPLPTGAPPENWPGSPDCGPPNPLVSLLNDAVPNIENISFDNA